MTRPVTKPFDSIDHNENEALETKGTIRCPRCNSDGLYKYGRSRLGKQRYLCLACNRQFVLAPERRRTQDPPVCPECGAPMHVYKRDEKVVRFRCAKYPRCKTFVKVDKEDK